MNETLAKYIKPYVFVNYDTKEGDIYYCECGEILKIKNEEETKELNASIKETEDSLLKMSQDDDDFQNEFASIYKGMKLDFEDDICCPGCKKDFREANTKDLLITHGTNFISNFLFEEDDVNVTLKYTVLGPDLSSMEKINYFEKTKYLRFEKLSKKIFFKDYTGNEIEFDLDEVVKFTNLFFVFDTVKVVNIMEMHFFIGRLANFIMDSQNIDIIKELLESLRGQVGSAGLDVIKKITSMFMGIIKYSNLSTIAMTKGPVFLYDLMNECDIPKPEIFSENNVTSPIKIFNFLVQNHIKNINAEVNEDNKEVHDFKFKSSKRINFDTTGENVELEDLIEEEEMVIRVNINDSRGKVKLEKGVYQVEDAIADGTVSKFIFNKIEKFNQYKRIIKFLKHVNKQELILMLQKYDADFLATVVDAIYFRKQVPFKDLERILDIILDFVRIMSLRQSEELDGKVKMDYNAISHFSFINYDDALMMMEVLKFDPKVHFNKIRTFEELNEYHNYLIKYFSVLKDEEKNGGILEFTSKFRMLEDKLDYEGPLEFRILSTPNLIIKEGVEMRHSASAYARNVAQGNYLIGQIFDNDSKRKATEPQRFTIGFTYNKLSGLEFEQVKGFANETGDGIPKKTDRFKKLMMEWLTIKDISFRPIGDLKLLENLGNDTNN